MVNFINSFNPTEQGSLVGIAFDPLLNRVFAYDDFDTAIYQYTPTGTFVTTTSFNGTPSNDFDLDFAPEAINLNGFTVAANSLLIANGDDNPNTLTAVNKSTGSVIGPNGTVFNLALPGRVVGGSYHATRNSFFTVDWANDTINEINLTTGAIINSFSVVPSGSSAFDVNYGDIEINQASGNLFIVSSSQNKIRELTPTGTFVRDIDLTTFGVTKMSGIAFDDAKGEAYISTTEGTIYRFDGFRALPTISINNVTITEGNSGTKNAVFTVTRTGAVSNSFTVKYATANGTATAGNDYVAKSGSLTFGVNETSKTISVVINGDTTVENNETFFVNLSGAVNATIADNQGQGTIINDDTSSGLSRVGDANNNNLVGASGNDTLRGLAGNDTLQGSAGNDILEGGTGADSMVGGTGNDTYSVDNTGDRIVEASNGGTDTVNSSISYLLGSNLENLTLTGSSNLTGIGNALNNRITGNSGANILNGGDGNDTLLGDAGNDTLNGGNGNDRIEGDTGNDLLLGSAGNDVLLGGDGNDTLIGGAGNDTLTGDAGSDRFVFKYADESIDRITDFSVAQGDKIVVSASGFGGGLTANANLTSAQFRLGSGATNASQRFIYNSSTGNLLFDQDGTGITPAVQIATLNAGLTLTNSNIFVES